MKKQLLSEELRRMQFLAKIITESEYKSGLSEEVIDFTDRDQFTNFLMNDKANELEGKKIKLNISDTFSAAFPNAEKFTGVIEVSILKRTGSSGDLTFDATLIDSGGYEILEPATGKKIKLNIPSATGDKGGFECLEPKLKGLFKLKTLEIL